MFQEFRTKAALRTALLAIRKRRGEDAGRDAALSARLAQLLIEYAPRCAAFYWSVAGEFDARAVIQHWLQQAAVSSVHAPLSFYRWTPASKMKKGRFQIPAPADGMPAYPDLLLIPCLGFDAA